jgi:hypothetical protein
MASTNTITSQNNTTRPITQNNTTQPITQNTRQDIRQSPHITQPSLRVETESDRSWLEDYCLLHPESSSNNEDSGTDSVESIRSKRTKYFDDSELF